QRNLLESGVPKIESRLAVSVDKALNELGSTPHQRLPHSLPLSSPFSKIEAGQLTLSLDDYSLSDLVQGVVSAVEPLPAEKRLAFRAEVAPGLPTGRGDGRRLSQVLLISGRFKARKSGSNPSRFFKSDPASTPVQQTRVSDRAAPAVDQEI